jgi:hypothetical protein
MSERLDYGLLLEHDHTGALAADSVDTSTVETFGTDEGFEVVEVWVYPPFSAGGALENLTVQLVIDGESVDLLHMHSNNYPPYLSNSKWVAIPLGVGNSNNPIENTCLKGKNKLQVKCIGGLGGITGDYKVKLRGYYFKEDAAVARLFGSVFNPVPATYYDLLRNKRITISRPVSSTIKNLTEMSGGAYKAPLPRVLPYISFAWNSAATTPNEEYDYALDEQHVSKEWEDFKWDFDSTEALLITRLAAAEVANSKDLWIEIADLHYPRNHYDIRQYTNELPFSNFDTELPVRRVISDVNNLLIHDEKAVLKVRDTGTLIGANTLLVGVWGKKFELPS